jgi:TonB family protein
MAMLVAYLGGLVPALGWALTHFLWQGALVALVLEMLLKTCPSARARHNLALGALIVMAALPVATFALLQGDMRIVFVPRGFPGLAQSQALTWEKVAVAAWLSGVAALAFRTAGGLWLVERLRQGATPLPPAWAARCRLLQRRMAGSLSVAFAQSRSVTAPLVAGWLKPMVLIPTAALTRVPADQLEALILHELAHVRRLDAFANLIQAVVETALFYHPAVWWVSRRIRVEREHCCDDLAVAAVRDPALYVRALQSMETLFPAAVGLLAANGGDLKSRAARVLGLAAAPERPALSRIAAVAILTAAGAVTMQGGAVKATPAAAPIRSATVAAVAPLPAPVTPPQAPPVTSAPATAVVEPPAPRIVLAEASIAPTATAPPPTVAAGPTTPAPIQQAAPQVTQVSTLLPPLVVSPRVDPKQADLKIRMRGSEDDVEQAVTIWPAKAYERQADGSATLRCFVDVHGLAERCEVAAESPRGKGFGAAALEMRPTFKFPAPLGPDGPVSATKTIAITFRAPNPQAEKTTTGNCVSPSVNAPVVCSSGFGPLEVSDAPLPMRRETMLDYPVWSRAADFDDLARAYPAKGGGIEGYAVAHCQVLPTGALTACAIITELPELRGFGHAALSLTPKFRVARQLAATSHRTPLFVDVAIRMPPPGAPADRTVMAPRWIAGVDPNAAPKLFPPEAVAAGLTTGRGVARCVVAADGTLSQCAPEAAEPAGLGFSEAAAKLVGNMKMNLWSNDDAPVAGGVVHIPVRLNLKGGG